LLLSKEKEIRDIARNLYWYDYLDADEMDRIYKGSKIEKDRVREWTDSASGGTKQGIFAPEV